MYPADRRAHRFIACGEVDFWIGGDSRRFVDTCRVFLSANRRKVICPALPYYFVAGEKKHVYSYLYTLQEVDK